jgi:chloramphenicol-sensitive protein RarD
MTDSRHTEETTGTLFMVCAFLLWGILPAYWKLLGSVQSDQVLAHRIVWSAVFASAVLLYMGRHTFLPLLAGRRTRYSLMLTGVLIGGNWFTYIYAVHTERIVESSMGYYINPLVTIFLGMFVLRERLNRSQWVAFMLALAGVSIITVSHGRIPWIALVLSGTFGLYGLIKKLMNLDALASLSVETLMISPIAAGYLVYHAAHGSGAFLTSGIQTDLLLVFSGVVTAVPLYWFAQGARRIPLSRIGFLQYLAPTLMLIIGVIGYGEPFTSIHAVSFGCIWTGLAIYTVSLVRRVKKMPGAAGRKSVRR